MRTKQRGSGGAHNVFSTGLIIIAGGLVLVVCLIAFELSVPVISDRRVAKPGESRPKLLYTPSAKLLLCLFNKRQNSFCVDPCRRLAARSSPPS